MLYLLFFEMLPDGPIYIIFCVAKSYDSLSQLYLAV